MRLGSQRLLEEGPRGEGGRGWRSGDFPGAGCAGPVRAGPAPGLGLVSCCSQPPQGPLPERTAGRLFSFALDRLGSASRPQAWPEVAIVRARATEAPVLVPWQGPLMGVQVFSPLARPPTPFLKAQQLLSLKPGSSLGRGCAGPAEARLPGL